MRKFAQLPVLFLAAILLAGSYGALHDQLSYTISPDYFHGFKFSQFRIGPEYHNRLGAALVGWYATWWMGLIIGIPVLGLGLAFFDAAYFPSRSMIAFVVVIVTALFVGLAGLLYSYFDQELVTYVTRFARNTSDPVSWARVGILHEFSYAGGGLGIVTGGVYLVLSKIRLARQARKLAQP